MRGSSEYAIFRGGQRHCESCDFTMSIYITNFTFCILHTQVRKDIDIMCPDSIILMLTKEWFISSVSTYLYFFRSFVQFDVYKGITFNSGFYFTTIAIYSCWLDTSSNKGFVFSTTHLVQREIKKIFTTLLTPSVSYETKLTTSTTLLSRLQLDFVL